MKFTVYSILSILCGLFALASCSSDEPQALDDRTVEASFELNVADWTSTRADGCNSANGGLTNLGGKGLNYILALYEVNGETLTLSSFLQATDTEGKGVRFNPIVTLGKTYKMAAYAHFGDALSVSDADKADFMKSISVSETINSESEDFYFGATEQKKLTADNLQHSLSLTRPYAKLRIVATDMPDGKTISEVEVNYCENPFYSRFDALTGKFTQEYKLGGNLLAEEYCSSEDTATKTILADYIPVNDDVTFTTFTVTVTTNDNSTYTCTFSSIPLKRNALTTLSGAFFTNSGSNASVEGGIDDNPEGDVTIEI